MSNDEKKKRIKRQRLRKALKVIETITGPAQVSVATPDGNVEVIGSLHDRPCSFFPLTSDPEYEHDNRLMRGRYGSLRKLMEKYSRAYCVLYGDPRGNPPASDMMADMIDKLIRRKRLSGRNKRFRRMDGVYLSKSVMMFPDGEGQVSYHPVELPPRESLYELCIRESPHGIYDFLTPDFLKEYMEALDEIGIEYLANPLQLLHDKFVLEGNPSEIYVAEIRFKPIS